MVEIPPTGYALQVTITSPQGLLYKGQAKAVTLINDKGAFDILPLHANFISLIKDSVVIYETENTEKKVPIEEGIAKVFENTVDIFVGVQTIV